MPSPAGAEQPVIIRIKMPGQPAMDIDLDQVLKRMIQQAVIEASAAHWDRRADTFDWIGPHCAGEAKACRNHAQAIRRGWIEVTI
jgi:hypothetical protein